MILLLLLLPTLFVTTEPIPTEPLPAIDWSRCEIDSGCFCVLSSASSGPNIELQSNVRREKFCSNAETGLQFTYFSADLALLQIQIVGDTQDLGQSPEVMLYNGAQQLFGCARINGRLQVVGSPSTIGWQGIKLFEKRSHFDKGHILCALTVKIPYDLSDMIYYNLHSENPKQIMQIKNVAYEFIPTGSYDNDNFFRGVGHSCNPFAFKYRSIYAGFQVQPLKDRARRILNCENYGPHYSMRYETGSGEVFAMKELVCLEIEHKHAYKIINAEGNEEYYPDLREFSFFCARPLNETCTDPLSSCASPDCPTYKAGSTGEVATLSCPGKRWIIGGKYRVLEVEPVCKEDPMSWENKAAFYTRIDTTEIRTEEGRCFTDYDCKKKSNLDYPVCKENDAECGHIDYSDGMMKCKDKEKYLKITNFKTNEKQMAFNFTCNKETGMWQNANKEDIAENSQVRCIGNTDFGEKRARFSKETLFYSICGIFACGILVALVVSAALFCANKLQNSAKLAGNSQWKCMKVAQQLVYCKLVFKEASQSTPDTQYRIVHGLRLISMLLETETVEPKIWEEAYQFLMRIQWTLEKMEFNISHMYSRYLYLEAKKITDKHGWTQRESITKRTDMGLMRTVAIRLLAFAMHDCTTNVDARKLLEAGFRQLGKDHYPHCGVLWSVMLNCRINRTSPDPSVKPCQLNRDRFHECLRGAVKTGEMPDEYVIPDFGTPAMQAIEALGGTPIIKALTKNHQTYLSPTTSKESAMRFFAAMGTSLYRNPAAVMLYVFNMWKEVNKGIIEVMHAIASDAEWTPIVENIMKLAVYYGKSFDAKKLQARFLPSANNHLGTQLSADQQFFEEAAEAQKEELRKWLAAHTDKPELKKKPVYKRNPKQDARIFKGVDKPATAATKSPGPPGSAPKSPAPPGSAPKSPVPPGPPGPPSAPVSAPGSDVAAPDTNSPVSPVVAPVTPTPPKKA